MVSGINKGPRRGELGQSNGHQLSPLHDRPSRRRVIALDSVDRHPLGLASRQAAPTGLRVPVNHATTFSAEHLRRCGFQGGFARFLTRLLLLASLLPVCPPAFAVIFYSTGDLNHNTTAPAGALANSGWQWVGTWGGFQGTAVGPSHFLAAKHVGGAAGDSFTLNGVSYTATAYFDNPGSDLRLWKVQGTFPNWAPLYRTQDENGKGIIVFGRGVTRGPEVRVNGALKGWQFGPGDGRMRWGRNVIMDVLPNVAGWGSVLAAKFDASGVENEAFFTVGDSSGPAFIQDGTTWRLAGLGAYVDGYYATSAAGPGFVGAIFDVSGLFIGTSAGPWTAISFFNSVRGAFYLTRVSSNVAWIDATIASSSNGSIAPAITQPPASQIVTAGATVTFSVTATGVPAPSYQWRKDAISLPGATSPSLVLPNVQAADAGAYTVLITNPSGSVTSLSALLTVNPAPVPPTITVQPSAQTAIAGTRVSLSVVASSASALTYQWFKDGAPVIGATGATWIIPSAGPSDSGSYTVRLSNDGGVVTSAVAHLTITPASRLINLSVRAQVDVDSAPLILGFVNQGDRAKSVLIRTIGPSLALFGVPSPADDPRLDLFRGQTFVVDNDNWGGTASLAQAFVQVGAFALNADSKDAALSSLVFSDAYTARASAAEGALLVEIYDADTNPEASSRLINLSARYEVRSTDRPLIVGFVIRGDSLKTLLIRGVGPGLAAFNVANLLADPRLTIYAEGGRVLGENDNWIEASSGSDTFRQVGAFPLASGSRDAALRITLPAGAYTAQLTGPSGSSGAALLEVYDLL